MLVIAHGLVNWISTEILVTSEICREPREFLSNWGSRQKGGLRGFVGRKVHYFTKCALCVGIWVGLLQGLAFGGPLQPSPDWLHWCAFAANGLLYKGVGHLALQLNALLHHKVALTQARTREAMRFSDMRDEPSVKATT